MKAEELRIGNYIEQYFEDNFTDVLEVTTRFIYDVQVNPTGKFTYKPILLTEEWLVRFGFEKNIEKDLLFLAMPKIKAEIHYEKHNYGNLITLQSDFGMFIPDDILYVHQLQNLYFALTGEELTSNKTNN